MFRKILWIVVAAIVAIALVVKALLGVLGLVLIVVAWLI